MLIEGLELPSFNLKDKDSKTYELKDLTEQYLVFFFYPKDNTPGCTIESKGFSKLNEEFEQIGVKLIGVSGGDEKTKTKFCEKQGLTTLMLSDTDFKFSEACGVYGEKKFMGKTFMGINRVTFVVGPERKILKVYPKVKPADHPAEVLEYIKTL